METLTLMDRLKLKIQKMPPSVYTEKQLQDLISFYESVEEHIKEQGQRLEMLSAIERQHELPDNVVLLRPHKKENEDEPTDVDLMFSIPNRKKMSMPVLVESSNPEVISKIAEALYEDSPLIAHLRWSDLGQEARTKVEELKSLSDCLVFIPEITEITDLEQLALLNLFEMRQSAEDIPLFVVGTKQNPNELVAKNKLHPRLFELMRETHLKPS